MNRLFDTYRVKISNLKLKDIDKETILTEDFLIESNNQFDIYYAPHNEYLNSKAKILIVGICPGMAQTKIAYQVAWKGIKENLSEEDILKNCKLSARFAGSMRKNIIAMLDELGFNHYYGKKSTSDLFDNNDLLHTTSLIPYSIFLKGKNYTGHNPSIVESEMLMKYVANHFLVK